MSKIIAAAAIRGAHDFVNQAETKLAEVMESKGGATRLEFPNTAFYLPLILATTGIEVKTVEDARAPLRIARSLLPPVPTDQVWLPYLGDALDAGVAALIAEEIIEALRYTNGGPPNGIYLGFTDDAILRTQGIKLVDGRMPGFAACVGAPCPPTRPRSGSPASSRSATSSSSSPARPTAGAWPSSWPRKAWR
jgi:acetyl-CoA synthase